MESFEEPIASLFRHGDCTSSFMACYPKFEDFRSNGPDSDGLIRFATTSKAWIAAAEPIASRDSRQDLAREFASNAAANGKSAILMPVSRDFADQSERSGLRSVQVGSEAVFELAEYFSRERDPGTRFDSVRGLIKRGARVLELDPSALDPRHEAEILALTEAWRTSLKSAPLGFLNQVDPLHLKRHKKLFALFLHGKMQAFLAATPIPAKRAFFFADYIRSAGSRAGTIELLFIEAMSRLREQGFKEVRLGLCPFARIDARSARGLRERALLFAMRTAFRHCRFPLNFSTLYAFKAKFEPTRWDPLYLVSDRRIGLRTLLQVSEAHFGANPASAWVSRRMSSASRMFRADSRPKPAPASASEFLARSSATWALFSIFLALHVLRVSHPRAQAFFESVGYSPAHPDWAGVLIAPFFHNNAYHLSGDILSFLFFGAILEIFHGRAFALLVVALGLWASNPIAHAWVAGFLPSLDPAQWSSFLTERDYGSSNAVYALAGALAGLVRAPMLILLPFALNGLFLCLSKTSWLSLHHLVGLGLGFGCAWLLRRELARRA